MKISMKQKLIKTHKNDKIKYKKNNNTCIKVVLMSELIYV